jgi:hypothetical protein
VTVEGRLRIPASWRGEIHPVNSATGRPARIGIRYARSGDLVDAYPAGTSDRELAIDGQPTGEALHAVVAAILEGDPHCRRVVLPVPEDDLEAIGWAEAAGFRFVVNAETRTGGYSLLVVEPDWVLEQPHALEDIPIKE